MKSLSILLAFTLLPIAHSFAQPLSKYELQLLEFNKHVYDTRGQQKWQVGLKTRKADEAAFKKHNEGLWYTGRVQVRRWGTDMNVPIEQYTWDPQKGHRWLASREVVYRDPETKILGVAYQGPNALDQYKYGKVSSFTKDLVGRESASIASRTKAVVRKSDLSSRRH